MNGRADRAVSFANTAELYELGRPGYPTGLLAELFARIGLDSPRILDLGAGTGKLTRQLREFGTVTAVEPLDEMRAQLERVVPNVTVLAGNAESIPLGDSSVDVVAVGQAYHWFDQSRANPEVARVLGDDGHLVMLWNYEKPVPWVVASERIMGNEIEPRDWVDYRGTWLKRFDHEPFFSVPELINGEMFVSTTKTELLARYESFSSLSVRPPAERAPILAEIADVVADFGDPFDVEYRTEAYWCRKLPLPAS